MGPARLHVCDCVASMRPPRAYWNPMKPMAGEDARSFWIAEPRRGEIRTETLRGAEPGDAVVRTLYSGVSRGTETLAQGSPVPRAGSFGDTPEGRVCH